MERCDRCRRFDDVMASSVFNTQNICSTCSYAETEHPEYIEARDIQNKEIMSGNYSFNGVGVPEDIFDYYDDKSITKLNLIDKSGHQEPTNCWPKSNNTFEKHT